MLLLCSALALAQPDPSADEEAPEPPAADDPVWTVSVDPLTTVLGFVHVQVERALSPRFSLYAGPSLHLYDPVWQADREPYLGIGVEVGLRWFPWGEAPAGGWLMTRGVVARLHTTDGTDEVALGGYGSVLGGYTWIVGGRLVLALGLGVQRLQYGVGDYGIVGFAPAAHTNIGVAF